MLLGPLETSGSASLPPAPYGPTGFEASGKRKGFCFGGVLFFSFPFPVSVCGLLLLRFPFRAVCFFGGFLALPLRPCVCVFTSVPKSNVFKKQGATLPFTREWPTKSLVLGTANVPAQGRTWAHSLQLVVPLKNLPSLVSTLPWGCYQVLSRLFMDCSKNTCCRPIALPLSFMTDSYHRGKPLSNKCVSWVHLCIAKSKESFKGSGCWF